MIFFSMDREHTLCKKMPIRYEHNIQKWHHWHDWYVSSVIKDILRLGAWILIYSLNSVCFIYDT